MIASNRTVTLDDLVIGPQQEKREDEMEVILEYCAL
jgi:hypothetical protein